MPLFAKPTANPSAVPDEADNASEKSSFSLGWLGLVAKLFKLLKVIKALKVILFLGTGAIYTFAYGLPFAMILMTCLTVHECGHLWAMKRSGFQIRGFYMIPFAGAMIIPERSFHSRAEEFFIATMGPAAGLGISLLCGVMYLLTGAEFWSHLALFNTVLNGFNLLPITPLDGGRMAKSIIFSATSKLTVVFHVFSTSMLLLFFAFLVSRLMHAHNWWEGIIGALNVMVWAFIILGSLIEMAKDKKKQKEGLMPAMQPRETWRATGIYLAVIGGFVLATTMTWADPAVRQIFIEILHS